MGNTGQWIILGPGGGGTHYFPTISPHDPDMVLTCSDMTGAYITYDGGKSWREFNLRIRVDAFAFDPVNPEIIYAGSSGLFRSEDRGKKWRLILPRPASVIEERMVGDEADNVYITDDNWPGGKIQTILVDPDQNQNIYAGLSPKGTLTDVAATGEADKLYIYFSKDNGESWAELSGVEGRRIYRFFVDPKSPAENRSLFVFTDVGIYNGFVEDGVLRPIEMPEGIQEINYASSGINPDTQSCVFYITTPSKWEGDCFLSGVWKSTDLGQNWKALKQGLDVGLAGPEKEKLPNFKLLAACQNDARVVYMTANRYPGISKDSESIVQYSGILKSEDEGETWRWVISGNDETVSENNIDGWREREYGKKWIAPPSGLGVCPTNPNICYSTDSMTAYRTLDGGGSWEQVYCNAYSDGSAVSRGLDVTTTYGVHFDPFDKEHIVISYTDIGMFQSFNGGKTWSHAVNGVPRQWRNTCYWMVFDPDIKGKAWSAWGYSHDLPRSKMFDSGGDFSMRPGGVCRTEDGMITWKTSYEGMPEMSVSTHIILDPNSPVGNRTLYVAALDKGVYKSTDDGYTWSLKNNGLGERPYVWRLTQLPDGTLYVLIARGARDGVPVDGALYRSTDGAEHWEEVALPEGVNAPNDLVFDPEDPKRMYLACWPRTINGKEHFGGLYLTENAGAAWKNIYDPSSHVYGVTVDEDNPSAVYIVTFDSEALRSDDKGKTWKHLDGYNFKWGHRVVPDPYNPEMIYITTYGSSVWYGPANGVPGAFEDIYPIK